MEKRAAPTFCPPDGIVYSCTEHGKQVAINHLPPEPKRTRYGEYCRADCFDTFAQFLGINKPKYEHRRSAEGRFEYRMFRPDLDTPWSYLPDVAGEWAGTKKEAKASYKHALAKRAARIAQARRDARAQ
jgi:hypothetical protein